MAEEDQYGETLLKKVYDENCAGCKSEQRKASQTGVPVKELVYIFVIVLSSGKHFHQTMIIIPEISGNN